MLAENTLRLELGRVLTAEVAPEELPFFDELVESANIGAPARADNELAFGGEAALVGVASVFLYQISESILAFIREQAEEIAADMAKNAVKDIHTRIEVKLANWIKNRFQGSPPIELSAHKRQALIKTISKDAKQAGLGEPEIIRLTNVLTAALAPKAPR